MGLRPTEAKAFQLLPGPSHRQNGCVTDDCPNMAIEDYIRFVVLGLPFNECSCERKPQEVVRILAKWGEAWLPV